MFCESFDVQTEQLIVVCFVEIKEILFCGQNIEVHTNNYN